MQNYRLLVVMIPEVSGVSYYRQSMPHEHLSKNFPEFEITYTTGQELNGKPKEYYKDFQLVIFQRDLPNEEYVNTVKSMGCVVLLDIDDHWQVPKHNSSYYDYKKYNLSEKIIKSFVLADHITTTTPYLKEQIKRFTYSGISILQNAIDPSIKQLGIKEILSDKMRFGYMATPNHIEDCKLMKDSIQSLLYDRTMQGKYHLSLGGFNMDSRLAFEIGGEIVDYEKISKPLRKLMKIEGYKQPFEEMEEIFTNKGRVKDYSRILSKPVDEFMQGYNELDVCLVPLVDSDFNRCKSELKMIEAGWFKKACICSDVIPYNTIDIANFVNNNNKLGFYFAIKYCIENPHYVENLGNKLHEYVIVNHNLDNTNIFRAELYKELIDKRND